MEPEGRNDFRNYNRRNSRREHDRRKKRRRRRFAVLMEWLMLLICIFSVCVGSVCFRQERKELQDQGQRMEVINLKQLYSSCAVLEEADTGCILAERRGTERMYPASLTKIMTVILAIENTEDLNGYITMPDSFFQKLYMQEASMAGFLPGEEVCLEDVLYGILLPSGAECCMAFAERIAGSEEGFAELMNQKAQELGMNQTHFMNCTGLHDPDHYTTAEDMALLLRYALQNETFRKVFTTSYYYTRPTALQPEGLIFQNTMFQKLDHAAVTGGEILGGKTGYTEEAGLCLASLAVINGKEYILVTAGADGSHQTEPYHVLDAVSVYEEIGEKELQTYESEAL